jgi:hypothetical protein
LQDAQTRFLSLIFSRRQAEQAHFRLVARTRRRAFVYLCTNNKTSRTAKMLGYT